MIPSLTANAWAGALYWNDFLSLAKQAGFYRSAAGHEPAARNHRSRRERQKVGPAKFYSATYRLFKIAELETACEDYGQAVVYKGGIPEASHTFNLDGHHAIEKGRVFPVCGNTWYMLQKTRFAEHFYFIGDFATHYGIYPGCGTNIPFAIGALTKTDGSCC